MMQLGTDLDAPRKCHAAAQHRVDIDEHVAADLDVAADVDAGGIGESGAGEHQFVGSLAPVQAFDLRELHLVVDAHDFRGVARYEPPRRDGPPCTAPATTSVR